MTDEMFKPGYDGERPKATLTGPEKQQHRLVKRAVIDRLHTAMLTLNAMPGAGPKANLAGGTPPHIVEFSDRVGEELDQVRRAKYDPSAADVSDVVPALALLEGLSKPYYRVILLRALNEFAVSEGETEPYPWEAIGQACGGMSWKWAEDAYDAAIIQATRRAGLLPMVSRDYGILAVAMWVDRAWLTNLSTASDPRQALSNIKAKSPVRPEQAFAIWVPGQAHARMVVDGVRPNLRGLHSHGAWWKVHPDVLAEAVIDAARSVGADWTFEEIPVRGVVAA